jgi:hypothetical protein
LDSFLFLAFSLLLHGVLIDAEKNCNSLFARVLCEREQAIRVGTLIHQQLNIMANDCDLSDKLFHALRSDNCAQSDKAKDKAKDNA